MGCAALLLVGRDNRACNLHQQVQGLVLNPVVHRAQLWHHQQVAHHTRSHGRYMPSLESHIITQPSR